MKYCTFKIDRKERVGVSLDDKSLVDVTTAYAGILARQGVDRSDIIAKSVIPENMVDVIKGGSYTKKAIDDAIAAAKSGEKGPEGEDVILSIDDVVFNAPVTDPSKIFAIAINNKQKFDAADKPDCELHPLYFIKLPTCITGPADPIEIPDIGIVGSESEVAVIISKEGKNIPESEAEDYIFGYTVHNDITAHELRDSKEWIVSKRPEGDKRLTYAGRYKCFDTFSPMGPWIVTPDEIPDINNCKIQARLNGKVVQLGSTADMHFKMPFLISYLSEAHTLKPGDIISWGTVISPPDVNFQKIDLRGEGGVLETEVDNIGLIKNPIKAV